MNRTALLTTFMLMTVPALGQSMSDKANALGEKTGVNSVAGVAPLTTDFVTKAAISDMFEIQSSQLAATKSDAATKSFAGKMIADHQKTSSELKSIVAGQKPQVIVPAVLDAPHQKMLDSLSAANGADFTKMYHDDQVSAHNDAVSLFQRYAQNGDNPALKAWAAKTLPDLQAHLTMAKDLNK